MIRDAATYIKNGFLWSLAEKVFVASIVLSFLLVAPVIADTQGPQTITLDGRLFTSQTSDTALIDPSVVIDIKIYNAAGSCILYEEKQAVNTTATDGRFTILIGSPTTGAGASKRVSGEPGNAMTTVFQNKSSIGSSCGPYPPSSGETRLIRLMIAPSTTGTIEVLSPDTTIDSVPNAMVAETLQGLDRDHVLAIDSTTTLSQTNVANVFSTTNYPILTSLLAGNYVTSGASGAKIPTVSGTPATLAAGQIWFNSSANGFQYYNGSSIQTVGVSGGGISSLTVGASLTAAGTAGGTLNGPGTIDIINSGVSAGTYSKVTVNAKGLVTYGSGLSEADLPTITTPGKVSGDAINSGTIGGTTAFYSSGNVTTTGNIVGTNVSSITDTTRAIRLFDPAALSTHKITILAPTLANDYSLIFPATAGSTGYVLATDGSGNLSWASSSSGSVTSVGLSLPPIFSVTTPLVTSTGTLTATLVAQNANLIFAGPGSGAAAAPTFRSITAADLPAGAYDSTYLKPALASGQVWVGNSSGVATAVTPSGDVTVANSGLFTVTKLQGSSVSATAPNATGQILRWNGTAWTPNFLAMSDLRSTITGALSLATCTASQTLVFNSVSDSLACSTIQIANSQIAWSATGANLVFAGPASGGNAPPTFRTLTAADLPATSFDATYFKQSGNAFGAAAVLGTTDAQSLSLNTSGLSRLTILSGGNVGVGTSAPAAILDVNGSGLSSAMLVPRDGNTRPTGINGMLRYNTISNAMEIYNGAWTGIATSANVSGSYLPLAGGTMTGAIQLSNGTAALPSASFADATTGLFSTGAGNLSASTNGVSRLTINSSGLVGVGTTLATRPLHVYGSGTGAVIRSDDGTSSADFYANGGSTVISNNGNLHLKFFNGSERMRIDNFGYVGIGTTTATSSLDVFGTGGASAIVVPRDTTLGRPTGVNGMIRYNTDLAKLETYGSGGWNSLVTGASGGGASQWTTTGSDIFYSAGKVGIGTSVPSVSLNVYQNSNADLTAKIENVYSGKGTSLLLYANSLYSTTEYQGVTGGDWKFGMWGTTNLVAYDPVSTTMPFQIEKAAPTGSIYVKSTGNVGIGTITPGSKLDVSGNLSVGYPGIAAPANGIIVSGNVGVGTNSPINSGTGGGLIQLGSQQILQAVVGNQMLYGRNAYYDGGNWRYVTSDYASAIRMNNDPGDGSINFHTLASGTAGGVLSGWDNTGIKLTIRNGGNVGIGTTTPGAILDVNGLGAASAIIVPRDTSGNRPTPINGMIRYATDLGRLETYSSGAWNGISTGAAGGGSSQWTTNSSNIYYSAGNVGIGTSTPGSPLTIASVSPTATSGSFYGASITTTPNPSSATTATYSGVNVATTLGGNGAYTGNVYGVSATVNNSQPANVSSIYGFYANPQQTYGSSTVSSLVGTYNEPMTSGGTTVNTYGTYNSVKPAGGTNTNVYGTYSQVIPGNTSVASAYGSQAFISNQGTGTLTNAYGNYVKAPTNTSSGSITNFYGLYLESPTAASTNYSIYSAGGANYFAGNIGIGTLTPASSLHIASATSASITLQKTGGTTGTFNFYDDGDAHFEAGNSKIWFNGNSNGNLILADGGGKVGIGTFAPLYALDVMDKYSSSNAPIMRIGNSAGGAGNTVGIMLSPYEGRTGGASSQILATDDGNSSSHLLFYTAAAGTASLSTERMRITNGGSVGIGTTNPGYNLHVVGNAGLSTGTAWTLASDIRLKNIQGNYEYGLDEILKLHTVRFTYKEDNALGIPADHPMTGIIAQEVQKVIPDAIRTREDGYLELNIDPIHWAVVNAIQDFYKRWIADSSVKDHRIEALENQNQQLLEKNKTMEEYLCTKDPSAPFCVH